MTDKNLRSQTYLKRFDALPAAEAERLDGLCDCFEQQLVANQSPDIEVFITPIRPQAQPALLRELLVLELNYLEQTQGLPDVDQYVKKFPDQTEVVRQVFEELGGTIALSDGPPAAPVVHETIPNYTLLSELGVGGMGKVYHAIHTMLKNDVAVKVLKSDDDDLRQMFAAETCNLGQLRHPHIVQALYAGTVDDVHPFLVMELVRGLDMSKVARRCGPVSVANGCEVVRQAALGIQHAHERGMVHRDIKPSNLMLGWTHDDNAEVKVADFGLARIRFRDTWHGSGNSEALVGTLDYMPPEQFFTPADVDIRADVFSMGCTLYALLVGQSPFAGQYADITEKMIAHRDKPVQPFRHLRPDVPEALEEVVLYAMAKDRDHRFDTPLDLAKSLAHFSGGHDLPLLLEDAEERPDPRISKLLINSTITVKPPI